MGVLLALMTRRVLLLGEIPLQGIVPNCKLYVCLDHGNMILLLVPRYTNTLIFVTMVPYYTA